MGKSARCTCTPSEPTHYTVLNPKAILADTTLRLLYPYPVVTFAKSQTLLIFPCSSFKTYTFFKTASFVLTLTDLPIIGNLLNENIVYGDPQTGKEM